MRNNTLKKQYFLHILFIICVSISNIFAQKPADLMENCKQWKITYPTGNEEKSLCDEPNNEYFYLNNSGDAIVFYAPIRDDNGTTTNSSYIRSELRERVADGSADIYWTTEGSHLLYVKQAITHLPINKSHLVATQIHGNKDNHCHYLLLNKMQQFHYYRLFLNFHLQNNNNNVCHQSL